MRKNYLLILIVLSAITGNGQTVRDLLLGKYTGIYWNYQLSEVNSGVVLTADPNDNSGIFLHDTINNVLDTFQVVFQGDTAFYNEGCPCGFTVPAKDSLFFSYQIIPCDNPNGEFRLTCTQHTFITGVVENKTNSIVVYPNPAIDILFIKTNVFDFKHYNIYNMLGNLVNSGRYTNEIDIEKLPVGIYYLKLTGGKETSKLFIKIE